MSQPVTYAPFVCHLLYYGLDYNTFFTYTLRMKIQGRHVQLTLYVTYVLFPAAAHSD